MGIDLRGRKALVTGGGIGIGAAIVQAYLDAGAEVAFTFRSHPPKRDAGARNVHSFQVDGTDEAAVTQVVGDVVSQLGGIDILVNNIGGLVKRAGIEDLDLATWHSILSVNLDSTFLFTHAVIPHLGKDGRVINIGSLAGHTGGHPGALAYATAKAAVLGFTRSLATEVGPRGITVNALAPGFIENTPFHDTFTTAQSKEKTISGIPVGRAGVPADVASAALWLASPKASFVSGSVIDVNGAQYFH